MSNKGKTVNVTAEKILSSHYFTRGVKDFLAGKGFDADYEKWAYTKGINAQQDYERGRHYAAATGGAIPTKCGPGNKRVNRRAIWALSDLAFSKAII